MTTATLGATSVTNTNAYSKKHMSFFWQPPKYAVGPVIFL